MKLSVIIANYNCDDFVGAAIESAFAVDWPDKKVIVVDDVSTDDSRTILESFQGIMVAYFRPKSHQLGARMFGFEQSTGQIIIFLDCDDMLERYAGGREGVAAGGLGGLEGSISHEPDRRDRHQLGSAIPQFPKGRSREAPPHLSTHHGIHNPSGIGQRHFSGLRP
jgi:glycosyltransferase involved in cell wall biosynthesis